MYYYREEDASRLVNAEVAARNKVLSLYGEIIRTVQSFDGKVLNKRLETALKKIDNHLNLDFCSYNFYISYNTREFSIISTSGNYLYLENIRMCFCSNATNEEGRICADEIVKALYRYMDIIENTVDAIQEKRGLVSEYKNRMLDISNSLNELRDEIPSIIRHYYGLDAYIEFR